MSGKSSELVQIRKYCDRLALITHRQHDRIVLMANTALSFRLIIQKYGRHVDACQLVRLEPDRPQACTCGWGDVEKFMEDDSNFGAVKQERDSILVSAGA